MTLRSCGLPYEGEAASWCGAGMVLHDRDHGRARLRCSAVRETFANARRVYLDDIEQVVGLRDRRNGVIAAADRARSRAVARRVAGRAELKL